MRISRWAMVAVACLALALWGCGGGDDDDTVDIPGGGEVNVSDDLPDEFPDDFPIYDGADFQGSVTGEQDGVEGLIATWETDDSLDDVRAFYDGEFEDGPWTSTGDGTSGDESAFWSVEKGDQAAFVTAVAADGKTTISVVISEDLSDIPVDEGSGDDGESSGDDGDEPADDGGSSGSGDLPDEVDLPDDFPTADVPLPDDIRVTNASSFTTGGVQSFVVEFLSQDSVDSLATHFKDEFEEKGWAQSFQTESNGQVYASYAENEDATGTIVTVTAYESSYEGYSTVALTLAKN